MRDSCYSHALRCCAALLVSAAWFGQSSAAPPALPEGAFAGWKRLRSAATDVYGEYKHTRTGFVAGELKLSRERVEKFGFTEKGAFLKREVDGKEFVTAANPEYLFEIQRSDPDDDFELTHYYTGKTADRLRSRVRHTVEPLLFAGFEILGKTMPDLVESDRFTLSSMTVDKEKHRATMKFRYAREDSLEETAVTGGTVVFRTDGNWSIESFDCTTIWGTIDGRVKYRDFDGSLVPEEYHLRMRGEADDSFVDETYKLKEIQKLTDDEPIWLPFYGLSPPNPDEPSPQSRSPKTRPPGERTPDEKISEH